MTTIQKLETEQRKVYLVGWVGVHSLPNEHLWLPVPPDSYKSDDAKERWIAKTKADGPILPYVGEVSEVFALNSQGETVLSTTDPVAFLRWANSVGDFFGREALDSESDIKAGFIGLNIKQLFVSTAADLWARGVEVPFRFWHGTLGMFEINDILIPGALRNGFDVGSLLAYGASKFLPSTPEYAALVGPGRAIMPTAEMRAHVTRALAQFAQMI